MKNLKLRIKFVVSFGAIILFFLANSLLAIGGLNKTLGDYDEFYNNHYQTTGRIMTLRRDIQSISSNIMFALQADPSMTKQYLGLAEDAVASVAASMEFVGQTDLISADELAKLNQALMNSIPVKDKLFNFLKQGQNEEASALYFASYQPLMYETVQMLDKFNTELHEASQYAFSETHRTTKLVEKIIIVCIFITILLTIILGVRLTRTLRKPIYEMEAVAKRMAEGDFSHEIEYTAKDELGQLAESMRTLSSTVGQIIGDIHAGVACFADGDFTATSQVPELFKNDFETLLNSLYGLAKSLSVTISQINEASDQVASGSEQVASGAQALSHGATEQASSIEELLSTINEISVRIKENATSANSAKAESQKMERHVLESNERMQEMVAAMDLINAKSNEIGKIIKTIDDIAFQTNILALNAAVEAARAGEAGKGFAVVADEVRNLAGKSAEAAKQTSALIEETITAVRTGASSAHETASSILSVVDDTKVFTQLVNDISIASNEQAEAVALVTMGMDQVSSVIQTNSATAEQSAAASQELSSQAVLLKQLVERFKLLDANPASQFDYQTHSNTTESNFASSAYNRSSVAELVSSKY